jgi:hypothetical protein
MTTESQTVSPVRSSQEFCSLLEAASQEVFRVMMGIQLEPGRETVCKGVEFTAMVGLAGEVCGLLSVPLRRGVIEAGGSLDARSGPAKGR